MQYLQQTLLSEQWWFKNLKNHVTCVHDAQEIAEIKYIAESGTRVDLELGYPSKTRLIFA